MPRGGNMRKAIVVLYGLFGSLVLTGEAQAISATCLPGGFPSATTPPVVTGAGIFFSDQFRVDVWRVPCEDGSGAVALLLRATPLTQAPFVCSSNFDMIQNGQQVNGTIRQTPSDFGFCSDLLVATTFSLERISGAAFDNKAAFTLVIDNSGIPEPPDTMLSIPAFGPQFGITVVATGCITCQVGQLAQFHIHVTNPGAPRVVELKTAAHFPPGDTTTITILGLFVEETLGTGEFDIPLIGLIVPGDISKGIYTIEAAILDPITGVTLSRNSRQATVQ